MTLVAAVVCPHPVLLIPQVGVGLDVAARQPALAAVQTLVETSPDVIVVVGDAPTTIGYDPGDSGSLAGYGVDLTVPLGAGPATREPVLPLSLTVGAWLVRQTGWAGARQGHGLAADLDARQAVALGEQVADLDDRVALLCMGDGSARRSEKAPGWLDPRAAAFDAGVAAALAAGDPARLLELDADLARVLMAAGRAAWQLLAGAARGQRWDARLTYDDAPYGVGYLVAQWLPRGSPPTSGRP